MTWDNIFCGGTGKGVAKEWGVNSYPTTFLIDKNGVIRYKGLRHDSVAPKVEELLAE